MTKEEIEKIIEKKEISKEELVATAKDLNEVCGYVPEVETEGEPIDIAISIISNAGNPEDGVLSDDELQDETWEILKIFGVEPIDEEKEEEEEEEEEKPAEKKVVNPKTKSEAKPKTKPVEKKTAKPKTKSKTKPVEKKVKKTKTVEKKPIAKSAEDNVNVKEMTRIGAVVETVLEAGKEIPYFEIAKKANELLIKYGGRDNLRQTELLLNYIIPVMEHLGIVERIGRGKDKIVQLLK